MASDGEWKKEFDRKLIRILSAFFLVVAVAAVMVFGIKMIGESERYLPGVGEFSTYHDQSQLQYGIFITIISTLALVVSVKLLVAEWKRKGVCASPRKGP